MLILYRYPFSSAGPLILGLINVRHQLGIGEPVDSLSLRDLNLKHPGVQESVTRDTSSSLLPEISFSLDPPEENEDPYSLQTSEARGRQAVKTHATLRVGVEG